MASKAGAAILMRDGWHARLSDGVSAVDGCSALCRGVRFAKSSKLERGRWRRKELEEQVQRKVAAMKQGGGCTALA